MVAHYPLTADLNDAAGLNPPVEASHAPFLEAKGIFCNGQYVLAVATACQVRTPVLNALNFSAFTISARFLVPSGGPLGGPVFVGGQQSRWVSYDLRPGGQIALTINSNQRVECSVKYRRGVWHEATVTFDGQTTTLYLDGAQGCRKTTPLRTGNEKFLLLTNFANGTTFYGVLRDLTVHNGVVLPTRRTPEPDTLEAPMPTDLTPADRFLATCPTRDQIASIDADLRLSFETDPTASERRSAPRPRVSGRP